jgi:RNA polymerase sigma factor for flagellar operon FliA
VDEDRLVREHMALAHRAVADMAQRLPRHICRSDLLSAALSGLAQAARSYDPARGITFDRFASTRIRGALLDELRSRDWASRSVRARARNMAAAVEDLTAANGAAPSHDQIAEHLGVDRATVDTLSGDVHRAVVLNFESMVTDGEGSEVLPADDKAPDLQLLDRERRSYLLDAVAALPERMRHVVVGYFFDERPMQELADELGVTESRISQMRAEALVLLRDGMNSQLDPESLSRGDGRRVANRKAAYFASVSSHYHARMGRPAERAAVAALA